jgi:hypothetical protein
MKSISHFRELDVYQEAMALVNADNRIDEGFPERRAFRVNGPDQKVEPFEPKQKGRTRR